MFDHMRTQRSGVGVSSRGVRLLTFSCACLLAAGTALGQYDGQGFEAPLINASPAGTVLTDQDGYYLPVVDTVDYYAYTYAGNALGLPQNPAGDLQFVAGEGPGSPIFSRAQRDLAWTDGRWTITYDSAVFYNGDPPGANNFGSFSMQPTTGGSGFIHLFSWVDPDLATNMQAFYLGYDAAGTQFAQPGNSPGPAWENLDLEHWYRYRTVIDFDTNMIVEVTTWDLTTGVRAIYCPTDWYLEGGSAGGVGPATAFRFFSGGGVPGNGVAWDNCKIIPGECVGDLDGDYDVDQSDLGILLGAYNQTDQGDLDCDGDTDQADLGTLLANYGTNC